MSSLLRLFLAFFAFLSLVPSILALKYGFPYGKEKMRGVNLGGWLLVESFTTPSLFDATGDNRIVDEWTFGLYQDKGKAYKALKQHWDTFITEKDFADMAAAGLNHVRIPIGHWMFDVSPEEPFIQGQLPYLLKAVDWAEKYGLKVIPAMYGAPGSQNGYIVSGHQRDAAYWHTNQTYVDRTTAIMKKLTAMFEDKTNVVPIIQVMNEPAGFRRGVLNSGLLDVLKQVGLWFLFPVRKHADEAAQYYYDSYEFIRNPLRGRKQSSLIVMLHDAAQRLSYWDKFMPSSQYEGVMMDTHIYQMFGDHDARMSYAEHIQRACQNATIMAQSPLMTIIGEWTATNNDCVPHLYGRFVGPRYDGSLPGSTRVGSCVGLTGKASTFSKEYKEFMRQYWEAQAMSYEKGGEGWVMWSWKMENADEWSYQAGLANGWIPQDPTDYRYPNICG
ncbi:exo-beta-1,3-glucanase [Flammula alnicola]|nr:exo-beta-1,3-glucanase [Flammula alnicola]